MNCGFDVASAQWIGLRQGQEDAIGYAVGGQGELILSLADGMGGHQGGIVASNTAVNASIQSALEPAKSVGERLRDAVYNATDEIAEKIENGAGFDGMGTTLICAIISGNKLSWVSVGDSHLYLVRNEKLTKLNADHSMKPLLQKMVSNGEITAEAAKKDPSRHRLRSAITADEPALVEVVEEQVDLLDGDYLLLASDGLDTLGPAGELEVVIQQNLLGMPQEICNALMAKVKQLGAPKQDNTSLLLVSKDCQVPSVENRPETEKTNSFGFKELTIVLLGGAFCLALFILMSGNRNPPRLDDHNSAASKPKPAESVASPNEPYPDAVLRIISRTKSVKQENQHGQ